MSQNILEDALNAAVISTPDSGYEDLPDGEYIMSINSIKYALNKNDNPMLTYTMTVIEGDYTGRKHWKNVVMNRNGEFKPGLLRAEMDFIYKLANAGMPEVDVAADFEALLDEITEAGDTEQPYIVDCKITRSKPGKDGTVWTNTSLSVS